MDNGTPPDAQAGDGLYTGGYMTGTLPGVYLAGMDFIDFETIFDSESPYDAGAWSIPYRIRSSQ
jgi:hypothetical protein